MAHTLESDYTKGALIGEGRFAKVFLCIPPDSGDLYAVKEVVYGGPDQECSSEALLAMLRKEANLFSRLAHRCLPKTVSVYNNPLTSTWHTVIELFDNGDLATMISEYSQANVRIPEERVLEIFSQLTDVLAYLHETYKTDSAEVHQIVHRNLRPENILLKLNGLIGLATLRLAEEQELPRRHMDRLAPSPYVAPEALAGEPYGTMADAWSLGCIISEMCTLERLFDASGPAPGKLPVNLTGLGYSKTLEVLVNALLQENVNVRCSVVDMRHNPVLIQARSAVFIRD
ncbi:Serine/threonine protein kinase [Giardia duodenalis]|uniref:non-specific serine/threonine protein kinase n=1 Tax=Giardia intestinalis TaxID=5741 RepID=V6TPY5_GIAIN|nr:Serine/threonine protein kinase [Giardia intestinalis]